MKKIILRVIFAIIFLSFYNSFGQTINIDGKWKLDAMRDTSGAMVDFTDTVDPFFYKNIVITKKKIILSHYDSKKIKGTWELNNNDVLQISLKNKTLKYLIKKDSNNNLILEMEIPTMDNSTFKVFGYYKQ